MSPRASVASPGRAAPLIRSALDTCPSRNNEQDLPAPHHSPADPQTRRRKRPILPPGAHGVCATPLRVRRAPGHAALAVAILVRRSALYVSAARSSRITLKPRGSAEPVRWAIPRGRQHVNRSAVSAVPPFLCYVTRESAAGTSAPRSQRQIYTPASARKERRCAPSPLM
ncbi:hypothetical protein AAFF_G00106570 [Aldrovandia affinis]|uniref:Uncharacterized protein n=1 Tax=Aldrovandia affinis TaxID=143900 RepID=A0AAD7T2A8_9TELE|nr:hypothetical protein AAFF_G00106570 [Aldrovandia affinis]